jgi:hypothetical protein
MKTPEQVLTEWASDEIRFESQGRVFWTRAEMTILADVMARRLDKLTAFKNLKGVPGGDKLVATLSVLYETGPFPAASGQWLAIYESIDEMESDVTRKRVRSHLSKL